MMAEDFGFNLLRLPLSWSFLEPEPGVFDEDYLALALQRIEECRQVGITTLVDLHQDGWSKFVGDDGAPFWAHEPPLPPEAADERFGGDSNPFLPMVSAAHDAFFNNTGGIQDVYVSMVRRLAERIADRPGVIGLELMNEPVLVAALSLQDVTALDAFHARAGAAVREVAPDLPIYFEPSATRNITDESPVGTPHSFAHGVYAPHIYTGVQLSTWDIGDRARILSSVAGALEEARFYGVPAVVTEFGHNPTTTVGFAWTETTLDIFDELRVSWAHWVWEEWTPTCDGFLEFSGSCWGFFDTDEDLAAEGDVRFGRGALREEAVELLARPYPLAVAGRLVALSYDASSGVLDVTIDAADAGRHIFAAPLLVYPSPPQVLCDGEEITSERLGGRVGFACEGTRIRLQ